MKLIKDIENNHKEKHFPGNKYRAQMQRIEGNKIQRGVERIKKILIALAVSVIIVTAFIGNNQRVSGKEIMKNMMMDFYEEVCTVRFRKTTEDTTIVVFEDRILTERELEYFFIILKNQNIRKSVLLPFRQKQISGIILFLPISWGVKE